MEDEREEELTTLTSIYPEIAIDRRIPHKFTLAIPVAPAQPIKATFHQSQTYDDSTDQQIPDSVCKISHLPPLTLTVTLPAGYPNDKSPVVEVDVDPAWLDFAKLKELESECRKLWEEYGCCQILFTYIDYVQQAAERMFDLGEEVTISAGLKDALVAYDRSREKEIFEASSYDCGVCLEPKRGTVCHRMNACGHVFCRACLQDFYNNAITEGDVSRVVCLEPSCSADKPTETKTNTALHPVELMAIGITEPHARRYVEMKRKKRLESDKSTIYCPRTWCQSPARSNRYPPIPADLTLYIDPDDVPSAPTTAPPVLNRDTPIAAIPTDRLVICSSPRCGLAFCRVCYATWHGDFARCWPRNPSELSEEEKASYDYIRQNTSACPTCSSPSIKSHGCNHMNCSQCGTHYCYLCGAWLMPDNPYLHYNQSGKGCYMRLWELEEGDEGQGAPFEGARRWEAEVIALAQREEANEEEQRAEAGEVIEAGGAERQARELEDVGVQVQDVVVHPRVAPNGRQIMPRIVFMPPPGPIDPMHEAVLRMERVRIEEEEQVEVVPPVLEEPMGGRRRGRNRARLNPQHEEVERAQQANGEQRGRGRGRGGRGGGRGRGGRGGGPGLGQVHPRLNVHAELPVVDRET